MSYCLSRVSHHFTISTLKVILIVLKNKMQGHFTTQWESLASLTLDFFSCFKKASKWKFPVQVILLAKKYFYRSCILIPPSLILEMLITVVQQKYFCSAPVSRLQKQLCEIQQLSLNNNSTAKIQHLLAASENASLSVYSQSDLRSGVASPRL